MKGTSTLHPVSLGQSLQPAEGVFFTLMLPGFRRAVDSRTCTPRTDWGTLRYAYPSVLHSCTRCAAVMPVVPTLCMRCSPPPRRRRSPSYDRVRRRSPSPYRHVDRRRRSPSPPRRRRRSPSPRRRRSPSPVRHTSSRQALHSRICAVCK